MERETFQKALDCAGRMLSYQPLTCRQLYTKLQDKEFDAETAAQVVEMFTERGYLNDEAYARRAMEVYRRKGYGLLRIRQELKRKGIDREVSDEVLADFKAEEEVIDRLLEKKLRGQSDGKSIQKATAALNRRGYTWEEIRAAVSRLRIEEDYE